MIRKLQNSEILPSNVTQPEVESLDASKNEISIESIELTGQKNENRASLIGERKLQAELQAAELNRRLEPDVGIVTNNNDPETL